MVTVILSAYKRLEHLSKQVQHIKDQSIPTNIWIDYTIPENYQMYDLMSLYPDCKICLLYTSPSPRDRQKSRMPSSA